MAQEQQAINVSDNPALRELVEEVARTRRSKVLRVDESQAEAVIMPAKSHRRIARRTSADDPFWGLLGIGASGKTDISTNHDKYLAEAKMSATK
jgi:hypothetical protein